MVKGRHSTLLTLVLAAVGVCWGVTDEPTTRPASAFEENASPPTLHDALDLLREADYDGAEAAALPLATDGVLPESRAWLVVASARQRRGDDALAIEAYQQFLSGCDSEALREFANGQIAACRAASGKPKQTAPSDRLPDEMLEKLADVDDEVHVESTDHFVVRSRNYKLSQLLGREAERALRRICQGLLDGRAFPHSVDIHVWSNRADYRANAPALAPEWSDGSFSVTHEDGLVTWRIDLTQLEADGSFSTRMLDRVLPHELCHVVMKDFFGDAPCPLMVNEGVAMLAEWNTDDDRLLLAGSALSGERGIALADLFVLPAEDLEGRQEVFYAEAFSFLEFLRGRMTRREFRSFLDQIKAGCTVVEAIERAMYIPRDEPLLPDLTTAWEDYAIAQAQMLNALE